MEYLSDRDPADENEQLIIEGMEVIEAPVIPPGSTLQYCMDSLWLSIKAGHMTKDQASQVFEAWYPDYKFEP